MARAKLILQNEFPYNIGARCINKEWFQIPLSEVWSIFCDELEETIQVHQLKVHSFVLMSNHFHLIASTPNANIDKCMHRFMGRSSRRLTARGNRINQTFGGRHFKCILSKTNHYLSAYKYNYRNPVTANICSFVEDYPFSTLKDKINNQLSIPSMAEDLLFKDNPSDILKWLNTAPNAEKLEAVRHGLKRPVFTSKKRRSFNTPYLDDNDIL